MAIVCDISIDANHGARLHRCNPTASISRWTCPQRGKQHQLHWTCNRQEFCHLASRTPRRPANPSSQTSSARSHWTRGLGRKTRMHKQCGVLKLTKFRQSCQEVITFPNLHKTTTFERPDWRVDAEAAKERFRDVAKSMGMFDAITKLTNKSNIRTHGGRGRINAPLGNHIRMQTPWKVRTQNCRLQTGNKRKRYKCHGSLNEFNIPDYAGILLGCTSNHQKMLTGNCKARAHNLNARRDQEKINNIIANALSNISQVAWNTKSNHRSQKCTEMQSKPTKLCKLY